MRVLVVEDAVPVASATGRSTSALLFAEGLDVTACTDALSALDALGALPLFDHPDAIVCDLYLSGVDGVAFLRRLRLDPIWATVPVIITTAGWASETTIRLRQADGPVRVVEKPFDVTDLIGIIQEMMGGEL